MKKPLIDLLKNIDSQSVVPSSIEKPGFLSDYEFSLYHIKEVTFDEDSPRKEAFENVLNSLSLEGIIFTYLLVGDKNGVSFYFGIAKDKQYKKSLILEVDDIGDTILKPAIEGNFRGSVVEKLGKKQRRAVKDTLTNFQNVAKLEGVPSVNEENEEFQGVDRLVDIMSGDDFCLAIMADPLSLLEITAIENHLHSIYDKLLPISKQSIQTGENTSKTKGRTEGSSTSKATGTNDSLNITTNEGTSDTTTKGTSEGSGKSTSKSRAEGTTEGRSEGKTKGTSITNTTGDTLSSSTSEQTSSSNSSTREFSDKTVQEWLTYIDDVLLKRVQYGKNKGLYLTNIYLFSNATGTVLKLGNTARSLFAGGDTNKSPLSFKKVTDLQEIQTIQSFQFPMLKSDGNKQIESTKDSQKQLDLLLSKSPFDNFLGNWLSTNELSVVAGLPQKEVVGLTLKEEVEFGLNITQKTEESNKLFLGSLVKSGLPQEIDIHIDKRDLDKHTFIAGVTGSGKTTTCHRLLESAQMPFLVIEPAKTEYRVLTKKNKNILIFTLGNDNVAPFRLNPFEFFPHENITSRVDMIKASIESAFDMEAAIPQLIEAAIYKCYEDKGWNIATSKNSRYENPFADGIYAFPTLSDLVKMTEKVVSEQGFDERLKQDYIGSIKARLQGLLIGSKGQMLDTARSIDFKDLATKNVILELEEIRNPSEKSLVMGFILANLNEAIRANYEAFRTRGERFRHITLIEEAHRLLSKFEPGDSQNKKQGVEVFADMLAEVRKYGEALIIVDQIPNKLTPEVLKNTNTKIIHKLFAKDDKEAVGNTMALSDEQKDFLSNLEPGRVILSSTGINKPLQVQIKELISTTNEKDVAPSEIRNIALSYYGENYKRGLIQGLEFFNQKPSNEDVHQFLQGNIAACWFESVRERKASEALLHYLNILDNDFMVSYILTACYVDSDEVDKAHQRERLIQYFIGLKSESEMRMNINCVNAFRKNLK
ncbi:type VI secretion protein [Photobacterium proteolyticum]|uniref:Type VI secretion protein n=1 Tax=Photobacterium proteolyticum TaxID=1903952 RepID=A0A1Q9G6W2_9GAMM|nr:ATP-binding protein [Photobacterium proteolyticum]OLQ70048.1 type VI secretion protein [Photobacterium proteolyticum]